MPHELDQSDFHKMIQDFPDQFAVGFDLAKTIHIPGDFTTVVITGMGGSALPGDLLAACLRDAEVHHTTAPVKVHVNRFYSFAPDVPTEGALHFLCSYSGNTEETLEALEEALDRQLSCVGISSGGKLEEICKKREIPHIKLPIPNPNFQPRVGTGYFIGAMLQVLINEGMIPDIREEVRTAVEDMKGELNVLEAQGEDLAKKLKGKTPIIYAPETMRAVAMVWKIKFNENAKTPAFYNAFPELNHNEMVGFTLPQAPFFVIMLRDPEDHPRNQKRFEITAELLREKGVEVEIIDIKDKGVYTKIFMSILLGDFTSYHLALAYGQDPTPVEMVEKLKKLLVE